MGDGVLEDCLYLGLHLGVGLVYNRGRMWCVRLIFGAALLFVGNWKFF